MKNNFFPQNSILVLGWTFTLKSEEAMVDDLAKACDIEKILVLLLRNLTLCQIHIHVKQNEKPTGNKK